MVFGNSTLEGEHSLSQIGVSVPGVAFSSTDLTHKGMGRGGANIGDFNGDGQDDLAIGAPFSDLDLDFDVDNGRVFVLLDFADLPPIVDLKDVGTTIPGFQVSGAWVEKADGTKVGERFGKEISSLGDFDGDGFDDFSVYSTSSAGHAVRVFYGTDLFDDGADVHLYFLDDFD